MSTSFKHVQLHDSPPPPGGEEAFTTPSLCVSSVNYINYDPLFFVLTMCAVPERKVIISWSRE